MAKTIIKEIFIFLLLLVVIALVLGVIFYDYVPNNKVVPTALKPYQLTEEVREELNETMSRSSENIVKTYYIDSSDLSVYASTKDYNKGKVNPFEDYTTESTTNTIDRNEDFTGGQGGKTR